MAGQIRRGTQVIGFQPSFGHLLVDGLMKLKYCLAIYTQRKRLANIPWSTIELTLKKVL